MPCGWRSCWNRPWSSTGQAHTYGWVTSMWMCGTAASYRMGARRMRTPYTLPQSCTYRGRCEGQHRRLSSNRRRCSSMQQLQRGLSSSRGGRVTAVAQHTTPIRGGSPGLTTLRCMLPCGLRFWHARSAAQGLTYQTTSQSQPPLPRHATRT